MADTRRRSNHSGSREFHTTHTMKYLTFYAALAASLISSCAYLGSPQGQALLATSEGIAKVAVSAAATTYGGPVAGQLASAGLDALASVLQSYVGSRVPKAIVKASPGVASVGKAVAPLVTNAIVTQADVNTVYTAAKIAAKK